MYPVKSIHLRVQMYVLPEGLSVLRDRLYLFCDRNGYRGY